MGDLLNMPNVSMIDLSSFQNQMGQQKKPKKKKAEKKEPAPGSQEDSGTA